MCLGMLIIGFENNFPPVTGASCVARWSSKEYCLAFQSTRIHEGKILVSVQACQPTI